MTEIIDFLKKYTDGKKNTEKVEISVIQLNRVIKALDDCISRQQAIDKMQELEDEDNEMYGCSIPEGFDGKRAFEVLKTLPSIQPTAKENLVVEDAISRQAVDRLAMRYLREPTDKHVAFYEEFIALPLVTPKPKTDVLDKIRDEIEHKAHSGQWSDATVYGMLKAVAIVDKYKAESEG